MKDSFDTKLAEHIQKSLRDHEMPYEPGAWEGFDLQRNQKKRRPVIWLSVAASLLLLITAVPVYFYYKNPGTSAITDLNKKPDQNNSVANQHTAPGRSAVVKNSDKKQAGAFITQEKGKPKEDNKISSNNASGTATRTLTTVNKEEFRAISRKRNADKLASILLENKNAIGREESNITALAAIPAQIILNAFPAFPADILPIKITRPTDSAKVVQNPVLLAAAGEPEEGKNNNSRKMRLSFSFSPQTQYAKDSYSQLNLGGGVVTEFPVSRRLSLNTGVQVAQQTLELTAKNKNIPTIKSLQSTDVQLTGLDIPVNLHYNFAFNNKQKNHVAIGFSSFTYLGEQYAYNFKNAYTRVVILEQPNGPSVQKIETIHKLETENKSAQAFDDFYLARLVNFSVGFERPFIKNTVLVIEPYTKIPIGKFTKEQIRFGTGGVHIRVGFNSFKRK